MSVSSESRMDHLTTSSSEGIAWAKDNGYTESPESPIGFLQPPAEELGLAVGPPSIREDQSIANLRACMGPAPLGGDDSTNAPLLS